jgi:hypothetical protein
MASDEKILVRNEVDPDKAKDFEKLINEQVAPAVERARKDLAKRWSAYRSDDADDRAVFFFLFEGSDIEEWELKPILTDALGEEEAEEVLKQFTAMLLDEQTTTPLRPLG